MIKEFKLRDGDDHIKLGQLLKVCNMVSSGSEAKAVILDGLVKVNNEICILRGKKIHKNDIIDFDGKEIRVI